jgi:hypothetical protein
MFALIHTAFVPVEDRDLKFYRMRLSTPAREVLAACLELYVRVAIGQWDRVAEAAPELLGEQASLFSEAASALVSVRMRYGTNEAHRTQRGAGPSAIATSEPTKVALDLWHLFAEQPAVHWSASQCSVERVAGESDAFFVTLDREARYCIIRCTELYTRIANGQWERVAETAGDILGEQAWSGSEAAAALMEVRTKYALHETLQKYKDSSLGVADAGHKARIAYDLWHNFGGGMQDRREMRLSDVTLYIEEVSSDGKPL